MTLTRGLARRPASGIQAPVDTFRIPVRATASRTARTGTFGPWARLDGRIALVTGAGRRRGIGRGIAVALARAGADVAVHARAWEQEPWPLEEMAAIGRRVLAVDGDLTDRDAVARIADEVAAGLGPVDVLVNNAGVAGGAGRDLLADYDDEQWYRTVDVNLNAVYLVSKAFLPGMVARRGGAIVNISSIAGRGDSRGWAPTSPPSSR